MNRWISNNQYIDHPEETERVLSQGCRCYRGKFDCYVKIQENKAENFSRIEIEIVEMQLSLQKKVYLDILKIKADDYE